MNAVPGNVDQERLRWLAAAVALLFVGDFFLIFAGTLPGVSPDDRWAHLAGPMRAWALIVVNLAEPRLTCASATNGAGAATGAANPA